MTIELSAMRDDAVYEIQQDIFSVKLQGEWPKFHEKCKSLCNNFLIMASANIYADLEPDKFFINLSRAVENWLRYLHFSQSTFKTVPDLRYESPVFSAVITQEQRHLSKLNDEFDVIDLKAIGDKQRFYILKLAITLAQSLEVSDEVEQLLISLKECEDEPLYSDMFDALLGLNEKGEAKFWECFVALLDTYDALTEKKAASFTTPIKFFAAHRYLWVEGLAWLHLSMKAGFKQTDVFPYCPAEALITMPEAYQHDWMIIPDIAV
ncbi:MAG: hypothetical protein HRU20_27950 [Pseudomonadales bacterium]|nr:hypothetical protein [Pseudomonadales bacterium]